MEGDTVNRLHHITLHDTVIGKGKEVCAREGRVTAHAYAKLGAGSVANQLELGGSSCNTLRDPHVDHGALAEGKKGELLVEDGAFALDQLVGVR